MAEEKIISDTPDHQGSLPILHVSGTHREMGQQIGEGRRESVQHSLATAHKVLEKAYVELKLSWKDAQIQAHKYLPFAEEYYPQYVSEIQGIAEGANVSFDELFVLNVMEALTSDAVHLERCTSIAVNQDRTVNGHVLAAHNEDWIPEDEEDVYVLHAKPNNEPPYLAMTYGGLIANVGFNAYGIAQLIDSVYPNDVRIGVPRLVVSRAALAAKTPGGAIRRTLIPQRAAGYNHLIAHESGEVYNVEVSALKFSLLDNENGFVLHTNHYLSPKMQEIENAPEELISSRIRYSRAKRLLEQSEKHTVQSLQTIQSDHVNFPKSICQHDITRDDSKSGEKTINALVIDLTEREMHIAWGNPCRNGYSTYQLEG